MLSLAKGSSCMCDALGSSVSLRLEGWCCSISTSLFFSFFLSLSFKEVVAVHLKGAVLLLNLELKIPSGSAHGLCSPQAGCSFTCVFITGLEKEVIWNFVRIASTASPLPRVPVCTEAQGSGVDAGHANMARTEKALSEARPEPVSGRTCPQRRALCLRPAGRQRSAVGGSAGPR